MNSILKGLFELLPQLEDLLGEVFLNGCTAHGEHGKAYLVRVEF